jgi:ubiquinone/menaquinone biosynthesis C-methylase UbiE
VGLGIRSRAESLARNIRVKVAPKGRSPRIVAKDESGATAVDQYWNQHTVHSRPFVSARESEEYLRGRNAAYPLFPELMDLYGDHAAHVVLDYGCGPGDDVTGFLLWSKARKVIGIDVSEKALKLVRHRLALHRIDTERVDLIRITDASARIPVPDESVDWIQCGGVLHHTSHPQDIVREFKRIMKPGAEGRLMLYNRDSVMYHLWVAYVQMIVNNAFPGLTVDQAFTKSTDGVDCPISDAWDPQRVLDMITSAGLEGTFRGGYLSVDELNWLKEYGAAANDDPRLAEEHRRFVAELERDGHGLPMWRGKYAGIGGVYTIRKASGPR